MQKTQPVADSEAGPARPAPSRLRAFLALISVSFQRQGRAHWLVWIALGLLALTAVIVWYNGQRGRWTMASWRSPPRVGATFADYCAYSVDILLYLPVQPPHGAVPMMASASVRAVVVDASGFFVFSNWIVFSIFTTFLLPLWSLTFATEGLGREREAGNLLWTLARPLPRPLVYLAKYLALLPWCLLLNVGGFAVLCLLAGAPGRLALAVYWPALFWATLAFAALFHLMAAIVRRGAMIALLYAFFFETIAGNLPGQLKRISLSFYTRCLMFDHAHDYGIQPERPHVYLPVSGEAAWYALVSATVVLLAVGMFVFARREYLDVD